VTLPILGSLLLTKSYQNSHILPILFNQSIKQLLLQATRQTDRRTDGQHDTE